MLVLVAACVFSLAAVEAALSFSGRVPIPPDKIVPTRPGLYEEFRPHGYRLFPSRVTTYSYPEEEPRHLTVTSNRDGFRGRRELGEPDARRRIVVLGDSMVFGEGVEEPERFTEQLEAAEPSWRVDNLGMTGFGPDLMLRAFEHVGLGLHPAVVVLTIYTDDFRRVRPHYAGAGFAIPRFVLESDRLATVDYPRPRLWSRWNTVSALREVLWRSSGAEWRLNAAILDRFREHARQADFRLAIVFLPGTSDTPADYARRSWLAAYSTRHHTPFLDLTAAVLAGGSAPLFISRNWHLNPEGHLVVAASLGRFLAATVQNSE